LRDDIADALGVSNLGIKVGAVCVYHSLVKTAVEALGGSGIPVAAVSTGFPAGLSPIEQRIEEIHASVAAGAKEIDIVITRAHVLTGDYEALYDEVRRFRDACGDAHMKAILATGELATLGNVARASMVAMQAGADFIKTSTGKEGVNATIPFGVVMCRMIREYFEQTGYAVGDTEKRYLKIAAATCSNGDCTGTLVTSDDDSVFTGGDGTSLGYHFDGTTFAYAPSATTYDCRAADDTVLIPAAYNVSYDISLTEKNGKPSGFAGPISLTLTPASAEIEAQLVDVGCPTGGKTVFDATLDPR